MTLPMHTQDSDAARGMSSLARALALCVSLRRSALRIREDNRAAAVEFLLTVPLINVIIAPGNLHFDPCALAECTRCKVRI